MVVQAYRNSELLQLKSGHIHYYTCLSTGRQLVSQCRDYSIPSCHIMYTWNSPINSFLYKWISFLFQELTLHWTFLWMKFPINWHYSIQHIIERFALYPSGLRTTKPTRLRLNNFFLWTAITKRKSPVQGLLLLTRSQWLSSSKKPTSHHVLFKCLSTNVIFSDFNTFVKFEIYLFQIAIQSCFFKW